MTERRKIEIAGLDLGGLAFALLLATWLVVNAWNWNSARSACAAAGTASERGAPNGDEIRECAEELLGK